MAKSLITAILLTYLPSLAHAHGRMLDPPSRMSAWRFGFDVFKNYNDNAQYCGGFSNQWNKNDGKCGICGDPWEGPRDYERPNGKHVQKVVITRTYQTGAVIDVDIEVTANHLGWFEFRLCDVRQSGGVEATLDCLNKHVLADRTGKTQFEIGTKIGNIRFKLRLPPGLECPLCVMQWKWHCGNNVGYGIRQEEFYACSDIAITSNGQVIPTNSPITMPPPIRTNPTIPTIPTRPYVPVTQPPVPTPPPIWVPVVTQAPYTQPTIKITYPPPVYTTPRIATLPQEVLSILSDKNRPLSERIRYYVMYQRTHTKGYSVWNANQVNFVQRYNPPANVNSGVNSINRLINTNTNTNNRIGNPRRNTNINTNTNVNTNTNFNPNANTNTNTNVNTNTNNGYGQINYSKNGNYIFTNNNNNNYNNNAQQNTNNNNNNYQVNTATNNVFCQACAIGCFYASCATSCPTICPRAGK